MIGAGFELYKWAAERKLEIPLAILLFIVLIILIFIITNLENKPHITSLCRSCKYEKRGSGDCLSCSTYKPKLFLGRCRSQCPFEKLISELKQTKDHM